MKDDSLLHFRAIATLAACKNFKNAATILAISPSSLSRIIAQMETRLGVGLFNRTTRSVSLTEAGHLFLLRVQPALKEIEQAIDDTNAFRDTPVGLLRINTDEGMARQIIAPMLVDFLKENPEMNVDLVSEGRFSDIVEAGFDAGIRFAEAVPQDMVAVHLGEEQSMAVVASPEYISLHGMPETPEELLMHECIRLRLASGRIYEWEFFNDNKVIEVNVKGQLTVNTYNMAIDAALYHQGIAYTGVHFVREAIQKKQLVRLLESWTPPFPGLRLYYPSRKRMSAGLRAFVDFIKIRNQ
ncbi:LysR family transcriptional regulator [Serratia marcescens]|uniref:LysR family transcriptional regulator n=1 Tax=Serratia marcescens TaxID=615 RepID=UPI002853590D|nr:LysR family transcriptional regulator [Serratia marcescens]MDR4885903.1 LysR family transcriptional regulator [Serratia marcescens]